jgi:hypothetical protein
MPKKPNHHQSPIKRVKNYSTNVQHILEQFDDEQPLREKLKDIDSLLELFLIETPLDPVYPTIQDYRAMVYAKLERYINELGEILNLDVD